MEPDTFTYWGRIVVGYTLSIIQKNAEADQSKIGVQLGRVCIEKNVPVQTVASYFGMTRTGVYYWFSGEREPRKVAAEEIKEFIKNLAE
jgi:hypothetical protein